VDSSKDAGPENDLTAVTAAPEPPKPAPPKPDPKAPAAAATNDTKAKTN
jgi:hypothetical protein